jgi:pentatricopeptide repeat protein
LRDRINNLRENELFTLKEKVSQLNVKFLGAAALASILAFFGIQKYWDLDQIIDNRLKERTNAALNFNDQFVRASTLAQVRDYESAIPIYQELYDRKPQDELLFYTLLDCLNQAQRYEEGLRVIQRAKSEGLLLTQYTNFLSFNNAGYFVMIKSISDKSRSDEARDLLKRAEVVARQSGNRNVHLALGNLAIYFAMNDQQSEANKYGQQFRAYFADGWEWSPPDDPWFKQLRQVRPAIVDQLKTAFANPSDSKTTAR